jgi:putative transposase
MARGNERKPIYLDSKDRAAFLRRLGEVIKRYGWECLAYCLLENHYHLIIRTPRPTLSRGMKVLNGGWAAYFNARHERVGHLFQGRFRSVLIRSHEHFLVTLRYVLRNPVAAELCSHPRDWPWSSYDCTLNPDGQGIVATTTTLRCLGSPQQGTSRFERFVSSGEIELPSEPPPGGLEFPVEVVAPDAHETPIEEVLAANPGDAGIALAFHEHGYSLRQISAAMGCGRSAVTRRLVAYESRWMLDSATWPRAK